MIHNLREAFNDLLNENDWMDQSTRKVARVKVSQTGSLLWSLNQDTKID